MPWKRNHQSQQPWIQEAVLSAQSGAEPQRDPFQGLSPDLSHSLWTVSPVYCFRRSRSSSSSNFPCKVKSPSLRETLPERTIHPLASSERDSSHTECFKPSLRLKLRSTIAGNRTRPFFRSSISRVSDAQNGFSSCHHLQARENTAPEFDRAPKL